MTTASPEPRHLAILVVYYLRSDDDLPLLRLHLDRIRSHTGTPYTLYCAANRATAAAREMLLAEEHAVICALPDTELRGSREHGYYLDLLRGIAMADGASHVCTLDVDSFPLEDDWVARVHRAAPADSGLAAVFRAENGDSALPHPSCIFASREFFERYDASFAPGSDGTPEFRRFLRSTGQAADTGIGVGFALWRHDLPWGRLVRTNTRNPHHLLAGVYADTIFHLGSASRGILSRRDLQDSLTHRLSNPIERLPFTSGPLAQAKRSVLRRLRVDREDRIAAANRISHSLLLEWLVSDPDGLLDYLRGRCTPEDAGDWLDLLANRTAEGPR